MEAGEFVSGLHSVRSITGTDPAANVEISEEVPEEKQWLLLAVTVKLVQGATQEPWPILQITDGTNVIWRAYGGAAKSAAEKTSFYTWAVGASVATAGATPNIITTSPLPAHLILNPGWKIQTETVSKGANTNYGAPQLYVVEHG